MAGRTQQKARTRQAIVEGCAELLDAGEAPTIERLVEHTQISRATIYRYFKSAADVVWHVVSDRDVEASVASVSEAGTGVRERVAAAERAVNDYLFGAPDQVRQFELGVIQRKLDREGLPDDRPARRLRYIEEALAPLKEQLSEPQWSRLRYGLSLAIGGEAVIALLDTCQLEEEEARDVTAWVCETLVERVLRELNAEQAT